MQKSYGEFVTDDFSRVNLFNDFLCAVCTADIGETPAFNNLMEDDAMLDNSEFNRGTVMRIIKRLNNNTASRADNMPPVMYKNLAESLAEPLALIFESFLSAERIPDEWRRAIITPILSANLLQMFQIIVRLRSHMWHVKSWRGLSSLICCICFARNVLLPSNSLDL